MRSPMPVAVRLALLLAVPLASLLLLADAVSARTLMAEYSVRIRGFPVGKARVQAELDGDRYTITFSGRTIGFARLFSTLAVKASAAGTFSADGPRPSDYSHVWTEDKEDETVTISYAAGSPTAVSIDPPIKHPEHYVPLTAENLAGSVDLVSAFLLPAADRVDPQTCERTLRLLDGRRRFDIAFAYRRTTAFQAPSGSYSSRVVVCSLNYRPVAGHRIGKPDSGSIKQSDAMEVWLAPVGGGIALPVQIQLDTRIGRALLQATTLRVE